MRSTCGNAKWLIGLGNTMVGISLGSDATTEHDCGTKSLAASFGYDYGPKAGVPARKITKLPKGFGVVEVLFEDEPCLLLSSAIERAVGYVGTELRFPSYRDKSLRNTAGAWDENNFAILCRGPDIEHLRALEKSFRTFDVMAGGMLSKLHHDSGGLMYAIASLVPQELLAQTQLELDDELRRRKILADSGVKERLRAVGRSWFSLDQTIWFDDTKTSIRVWLNPEAQYKYAGGWFTLEELEQWVTDEGPVIIQKVAKAK